MRPRSGETARFLDFVAALATREGEMHDAMQAEGVLAEAMFLERAIDAARVALYTRAEDLAQSSRAFQASDFAIDGETRATIEECRDPATA